MPESKPALLKPWNYFLLTLGLTWLFWIPAALAGVPEPALLPTVLHYIGGSMPFLVTLGLLLFREDRAYRQEYWQRLVQFKRIPWAWLLLLVVLTPLLAVLAGTLDSLMGGAGLELEASFNAGPLSLLSFALFMLLFGPLPEEMGWRGYALDWLQNKHTPLLSSFILGAIWGLWHVPLFFIEGSYQYALRGTPTLAYFFIGIFPTALIMTWIFNNTRRSTLSAVLLHWLVNMTGEFMELSPQGELFNTLLWILAAVLVAVIWRADKMDGKLAAPQKN